MRFIGCAKLDYPIVQSPRKLKISINRVIEYGKRTPDDFCKLILSLQNIARNWIPSEEIVSWLKEHPDLTGAQIFDRIEDRLSVTSVAENTVRNYVKEIR